MTLGFQFPEMPLGDVEVKAGGVAPLHILKVVGKSGITTSFTITTKVAEAAHCPGVGVNK